MRAFHAGKKRSANADLVEIPRTIQAIQRALSPSTVAGEVSSSFRAHFGMHSSRSAISLSGMVCAFPALISSSDLHKGAGILGEYPPDPWKGGRYDRH